MELRKVIEFPLRHTQLYTYFSDSWYISVQLTFEEKEKLRP
jgi:hypothetical protein